MVIEADPKDEAFELDASRHSVADQISESRIVRHSNPQDRMSALGQKRTSEHVRVMSALPPKADID